MEALRNLIVWKRSCQLSVQLYRALNTCRNFNYRDQVTRSALSIASNIAEGYERDSIKELARFLRIAKGSCGELWTQIQIGVEAELIDKTIGKEFGREAAEISRMLHGLIRYYNARKQKSAVSLS